MVMKKIQLFSALLVLMVACTLGSAQTVQMSPVDFEKKLTTAKEKQIVDVRTAEEYSKGHLAGAVLIDYYKKDFKDQLSKLDKSKPVFVYCAAGGRSGSASEVLDDLGFKQVYDMKGGMNAWTKAGKPVVK
jgi:rhodanese-related sulfurtransferase